MSAAPRVSVVIASRDRPEALTLCLKALQFQSYRPFEVIVVACPKGQEAVQSAGLKKRVTLIPQGDHGLSIARNQGLAAAEGSITVFVDDDAIPDPPWLARLVKMFQTTGAAGVGGWVRSNNGISFEWTGGAVSEVLLWDRGAPTVMGTNMAFQTDTLRRVGGFDPEFAYYLEEADLTMRLERKGLRVVHAPRAQVHHLGAPNAQRDKGRVPRSLRRIGKSEAVFLRRHCADEGLRKAAVTRLRSEQRKRLLRMMVPGPLGPEEVRSLMRDYDAGVKEGMASVLPDLPPIQPVHRKFRSFSKELAQRPQFLHGRPWQRRLRVRQAKLLADQGIPVSLFLFSPTALFHRRAFGPEGVWIQTGGLWGRAGRAHPLAQITRFSTRLKKEITRVADSFSD